VQVGREKRRLTLKDMSWLEAERDFMCVHMNGHSHLVNASLETWKKALDEHAILRVHRSAVVRKDKVRGVLRGRFSLCARTRQGIPGTGRLQVP
jgi:DNA-binding LytR/AlgR family response regulator